MAIWVGGFTHYASVVVPILHDEFDSIMGSAVTRRVTNWLNLIGLVALILSLISAPWLPTTRTRWWLRSFWFGWIVSVTTLLILAILHWQMDHHLDEIGLTGFYPWHRAYLITSTVQWVANLLLMAGSFQIATISTTVSKVDRPEEAARST